MAETPASESNSSVRGLNVRRWTFIGVVTLLGLSALAVAGTGYREQHSVFSHPCEVSLQQQVARRLGLAQVSQREVIHEDDSTQETWCAYEATASVSVEIRVNDTTTAGGDWITPLKGRATIWTEYEGPGRAAAYSPESRKPRPGGGYSLFFRAVGESHAVDLVLETDSRNFDESIQRAALIAEDALIALEG